MDYGESYSYFANEQVHVVTLSNYERFEIYVVPGKRHSSIFALNGAVARNSKISDQIFILSYAPIDPAQEKPNLALV